MWNNQIKKSKKKKTHWQDIPVNYVSVTTISPYNVLDMCDLIVVR